MTGTPRDPAAESLADLLGGRRAAIDATVGPLAFGIGYSLGDAHALEWGVGAAAVVSVLLAIWRISAGDKPRAVLIGLLGIGFAALIALRTGHGEAFFLIRIATNAASALAWAVSIVIRWPLLGVVVGLILLQGGRWRHDPDLLRAYSRGSWVWVGQYLLRLAVWLPLAWAGMTRTLAFATAALTWPLIAACLAASWWVMRRSLPAGHPGLRHPVLPEPAHS
ncbi:DUF3159 domain-containing protein [Catellatospora sp. KI3]|uniref:DUF3159 domain-containing protein n=1 Tax=Catellatospora sp. KI3 TaxID=3041620 RepID=UPI002482C45A|nr:DUF3159 domain-containing protein [Catellatospora sp. KI3]MDI1464614.1 DUF3159 domain-containing protein [Catellatospora sp. KI3]